VKCVWGISVLFNVTVGLWLCSCVSLVRRVAVDLDGATFSLFCVSQCDNESKYGCTCCEQVFAIECVDVIVTSSA